MTTAVSMPVWLADDRRGHQEAYRKQGLPTRRHERWKYADVSFMKDHAFSEAATEYDGDQVQALIDQRRLQYGESVLLVFVNGRFVPSLSQQAKLPAGVIACNMSEALCLHEALVKAHWPATIDVTNYPFACLNAAEFADGLFIYVPDECQLTVPVHVLYIAADNQTFMANVRHVFVFGERSKVTMVEEYLALSPNAYLMNMSTSMTLHREANVEHFKLQHENVSAIHMANTFVNQQQQSNTDFLTISTGSVFARDDLVVNLLEVGADCHACGFYQLHHDDQYIDHHVDINHAAPRSNSEMLYKGTIDKKSRAVFNGRVHVAKDSQKIVAHQANHNLLLSNEAEAYSKPELEIYADDVKCKHGATTGQLDQEALFYMCSRGISRKEALGILLQGFSEEITRRIAHRGIKLKVQAQLLSTEAI